MSQGFLCDPQHQVIRDMLRKAAAMRNSLFDERFISESSVDFLRFHRIEYSILGVLSDGVPMEKHELRDDIHKEDYEKYLRETNNLYNEIYETVQKGSASLYEEKVDWIVKQLKHLNVRRRLAPLGNLYFRVDGPKIMTEVDQILQACKKGDIEGIKSPLKQMKIEAENVHKKLTMYLELHEQLQKAISPSLICGVRSKAAAMRDSLAKEGFNIRALAALRGSPDMLHGSYARHFKIIDGLCHLINKTLHEEPTGLNTLDLLTRLPRQLDLLQRLQHELQWVRDDHHKIMIEFREMLQAFYKHDMKGILSALEKVKIEIENLTNKVDDYFKLVDLDRPEEDKAWDNYLRELKQDWSKLEVADSEDEPDSPAHSS